MILCLKCLKTNTLITHNSTSQIMKIGITALRGLDLEIKKIAILSIFIWLKLNCSFSFYGAENQNFVSTANQNYEDQNNNFSFDMNNNFCFNTQQTFTDPLNMEKKIQNYQKYDNNFNSNKISHQNYNFTDKSQDDEMPKFLSQYSQHDEDYKNFISNSIECNNNYLNDKVAAVFTS